MLSLIHPEILKDIRLLSFGLMPFHLPDGSLNVAIKASKEHIIAARIKNSFSVYLIKNTESHSSHLGIITAFFDDPDEPLIIQTPLFNDDELLKDIVSLFSQQVFNVYFFDEHNREMMGARVENQDSSRFASEINSFTFPNQSLYDYFNTNKQMSIQFGSRTSHQDEASYLVNFTEELYPSNSLIIHSKPGLGYYNTDSNVLYTALERDKNHGYMQEQDIAILMNRIFNESQLFLNPFRDDTKEELTDLMVVTDNSMLFIQVKDSPNTHEIISRTIERKRKTVLGHIKKASRQVSGALRYAKKNNGVIVICNKEVKNILLNDKILVGIVIVKELFDDDYFSCSVPILEVMRTLNLPVCLMDYFQLHTITHNISTESEFINILQKSSSLALEKNRCPKIIYSTKL